MSLHGTTARKRTCPACGRSIDTGPTLSFDDGETWVHVECVPGGDAAVQEALGPFLDIIRATDALREGA